MDIEPRLSNDIGKEDVLQLEILTDHQGKSGVEPSLKFDINLLNSPKNLFKNTLSIISKH